MPPLHQILVEVAAEHAALWMIVVFTVALSTARYMVQTHKYKCLLLEDWIHITALAQALALMTIFQLSARDRIANELDDDRVDGSIQYSGLRIASMCLYWTTIFTAKAVLLATYKRVFGSSKRFVVVWWLTVCFTLTAFVAAFVSQFFMCGVLPRNSQESASQCDDYTSRGAAITILSLISNSSTDILLIVLPLSMLGYLHVSRSTKVQLMAIFAFATLLVLVDTFGWVYHSWSKAWLVSEVLHNVEPHLAVAIAALPAFLRPQRRLMHLDARQETWWIDERTSRGVSCFDRVRESQTEVSSTVRDENETVHSEKYVLQKVESCADSMSC